jgi:hypothetical protein
MAPVLERVPFDPTVLIHSNAGSWFWLLARDDLDSYGPLPLSVYSSACSLRRQLRLYVAVCRFVYFSDRLKNWVRNVIESEFDVEADRTIDCALLGTFRTRLLISLMLYELFGEVLERLKPTQVIIGTLSPVGKAMMNRSIDTGIDTFHVPHSVATWQSPNPRPELTQFVAGELDVRYYRESAQVREAWNMVVTGRPYLTELYSEYASTWTGSTGPDADRLRVLVATQPFQECRELVGDVVDAAIDCERGVDILVKPHPSEEAGIYESLEDNIVTVVGGDLFDLLEEVDLSVTISSNVGLESVIVGTPATVTAEIERQYEAIGGVGHLIATLHHGDAPHEKTMASLELFGDEVLPELA